MLLSDILYYMKDLDSINREREGRANLSQYKDLIETISKVEYKKFSNLGLIEFNRSDKPCKLHCLLFGQ